MSVLYGLTTLDHHSEMVDEEWLEAIGFRLPANPRPSRYPTEDELRVVLDSLDGYRVSYHIDEYEFFADITSTNDPDCPDYIGVRLSRPLRDEHPTLVFENGSDRTVLMIAEKLTHTCGPMILDNGYNGAPVLVTPGIDMDVALKDWLRLSDIIDELTSHSEWRS